MAVLHDFECPAHGRFEAFKAICPYGCKGGVKKVFLQAPGYIGVRTKNKDAIARDIARKHGLTDLSNRDGLSVMENNAKKYPKKDQSIALPKAKSIGEALALSGQFNGADRIPTGAQSSFTKQMLPGLRNVTAVAGRYNGE